MNKDYENFVQRMGSFDLDAFDLDEPLEHHGVKGMKWGRRKGKVKKAGRLSRSVGSAKRALSWKETYQNRGSMSDSELITNLNRLRNENQFRVEMAKARQLSVHKMGALANDTNAISNTMKNVASLPVSAVKIKNSAKVAAKVAAIL